MNSITCPKPILLAFLALAVTCLSVESSWAGVLTTMEDVNVSPIAVVASDFGSTTVPDDTPRVEERCSSGGLATTVRVSGGGLDWCVFGKINWQREIPAGSVFPSPSHSYCPPWPNVALPPPIAIH